jgi:hypothetical protein
MVHRSFVAAELDLLVTLLDNLKGIAVGALPLDAKEAY